MADTSITSIHIPYPETTASPRLRIGVGPAKLRIAPGDETAWVSGTYNDPTGGIPCRVATEGATARISQDHRWRGLLRGTPSFDLRLGTGRAYGVTIEAGATDESECDLGGVPITDLDVKHGAGRIALGFSAPNPAEMARLHLAAGAAETELTNLANANAAEIVVEGGAAAFTLDFGGELRRDVRVRINAGMATVTIRVPAETAAKITPHAVLGNVDPGDGFTTREGGYWTGAALAGEGPTLSIDASVALGSLKLRTS